MRHRATLRGAWRRAQTSSSSKSSTIEATEGSSDVVAAIDYAVENRERFNIRVINLSVAAGVYESFATDPLTQAALRAVRSGILVVAAAGNLGSSATGAPRYGSITSPGNAPWVLTVGASDVSDTAGGNGVASFSSRGPSAFDGTPKPDILAPGGPQGSARTMSRRDLRLSGTSIAAPIVAATAALMLQVNASLSPNAIKAILQFTAHRLEGVDESTQGAGLLNARGAIALAQWFAGAGDRASWEIVETEAGGTSDWGRRIIWGAARLTGAELPSRLPAWNPDVLWGARTTPEGDALTWGGLCSLDQAGCPAR